MSNLINGMTNIIEARPSFVSASAAKTSSGPDFMAALTRLFQEPERVIYEMTSKDTIDLGDFGVVENGTSAANFAVSLYLQRATTAFQSALDALVLEYKTWPQEVSRMF
jgi:hypothetical protein